MIISKNIHNKTNKEKISDKVGDNITLNKVFERPLYYKFQKKPINNNNYNNKDINKDNNE